MADQGAIAKIVSDCERYWRATGVPGSAIRDMRLQLETHLTEASVEGHEPERVVGPDTARFAESWAVEFRHPADTAKWDEVNDGGRATRRAARMELVAYTAGAVALVTGAAVGSRVSGGESVDDNETWRWIWTFLAVGMGIGEIFTAGFFLLPFAVGAMAAGVLAWLSIGGVATQWLVFFGVSAISFAYLRRFVNRQDEGDRPRIGADRWVGAIGLVTGDIDPHLGVGMVKIDGEQWRATTTGDAIAAGAKVRVTEVRGTRLVVETLD